MKITYTQLKNHKNTWGIRVERVGERLQPKAEVIVTKKSGATETETLGEIVWKGLSDNDPKITITIYKVGKPSTR